MSLLTIKQFAIVRVLMNSVITWISNAYTNLFDRYLKITVQIIHEKSCIKLSSFYKKKISINIFRKENFILPWNSSKRENNNCWRLHHIKKILVKSFGKNEFKSLWIKLVHFWITIKNHNLLIWSKSMFRKLNSFPLFLPILENCPKIFFSITIIQSRYQLDQTFFPVNHYVEKYDYLCCKAELFIIYLPLLTI